MLDSEGEGLMYDIFLSHRNFDNHRVRQLSENLEAWGVTSWFDDYGIEGSDEYIERIEDALEKARFFGVILTPIALDSRWVSWEIQMAVAEKIDGNLEGVVPLVFEDCDIPPKLKPFSPVYFCGDYYQGLEKLLRLLSIDFDMGAFHTKTTDGVLRQSYERWSNSGGDDHLLPPETINRVFENSRSASFTPPVIQYVVQSFRASEADSRLNPEQLQMWLKGAQPPARPRKHQVKCCYCGGVFAAEMERGTDWRKCPHCEVEVRLFKDEDGNVICLRSTPRQGGY